jgi:hypothetical protein
MRAQNRRDLLADKAEEQVWNARLKIGAGPDYSAEKETGCPVCMK